MNPISLLHANTNTLSRIGLKTLFETDDRIKAFFEAANKQEVFDSLANQQPDLLILDIDQTEDFYPRDVQTLTEKFPQVNFLIISSIDPPKAVMSVLQAGVQGVLTPECDEEEIMEAVFSVSKGEKFYCNKVLNLVVEKYLEPDVEENCDPTILSEREIEIVVLISKGFTNKEVADQLHLSHHTVSTHRKNILKKLGVKSTSGLVLYAVTTGLIEVPGQL